MVKNRSGAYAFKASDMTRINRWLLTGSQNNSFFAKKEELTKDNINIFKAGLNTDLKSVADSMVYASTHGVSQSTVIFALALMSAEENFDVKQAFKKIFPMIIRTASQLYEFLMYVSDIRGFGKVIRTAVVSWFKNNKNLEYQLLKYQSRNGWAHRDVLRKFHIVPSNDVMNALFKWAVSGWKNLSEAEKSLLMVIPYFESIKENDSEENVIRCIREGKLSWEMVIGNSKNMTVPVWEALLENMPINATLRYLATLTANGLFEKQKNLDLVVSRFLNPEILKKAYIHPLQIAKALSVYEAGGEGGKSSLTYMPNRFIVDMLNRALELSTCTLQSSGKNVMVSVDVSGSMWYPVSIYGNLNPGKIAGILALSLKKAEGENAKMFMFSKEFNPINITERTSYSEVLNKQNRDIWPPKFGGTDASLAYKYARENKIPVDVFISITDNESWDGKHPYAELDNYRREVNPYAKAVYMSLSIDSTTLVNPTDLLSYDICGFSDETVKIVQMIIQGEI